MSKTTTIYKLKYSTLTIAGIANESPLYRSEEGLVWVALEYAGSRNILYPVMYNMYNAEKHTKSIMEK